LTESQSLDDLECGNCAWNKQGVSLEGEEEDCYRVKCNNCGNEWLVSKADLDAKQKGGEN
jgi:hypothetical protein